MGFRMPARARVIIGWRTGDGGDEAGSVGGEGVRGAGEEDDPGGDDCGTVAPVGGGKIDEVAPLALAGGGGTTGGAVIGTGSTSWHT